MLEKLPEFVGQALQGHRAGLENILSNKIAVTGAVYKLEVSSPAFPPNGVLPVRFTADTEPGVAPRRWGRAPDASNPLAVKVDGEDAPQRVHLWRVCGLDIDPSR